MFCWQPTRMSTRVQIPRLLLQYPAQPRLNIEANIVRQEAHAVFTQFLWCDYMFAIKIIKYLAKKT
jgi:hypothetical protein